MPAVCLLSGRNFHQCSRCFDNHAVPASVIMRTVNDVGWKTLAEEVRRSIRVHHYGDYLEVLPWARIMLHQQLVTVPVAPDPDQQMIDAMKRTVKLARAIRRPAKVTTPPRRSLMQRLFKGWAAA